MPRHKHTLSHYRLLTGDMGRLYPVGLVEVLPKDTFQHSTSMFLRFSPMAAPVMHPVTVRMHHFFVPHRLVWPESEGGGWEQFITSGPDGTDVQEVPTVNTSGTAKDLYDYYGLPQEAGLDVSALPIRGFNLIHKEWYRDQDLAAVRPDEDATVPLVSWEKDYLTTARPWPQKGPAITLPLGTQAPIVGLGASNTEPAGTNSLVRETGATDPRNYDASWASTNENIHLEEDPNNPGYPRVYADLSSAEAVPINEFRKAFALQRYAEARARYGSRYTEYLKYLGCNPRDSRLQRPEYLAGGKARVAMSEVLQTSDDPGGSTGDRFGIGDMYGHGVAHMRSNSYRRTFDEHGYVHTLVSVRPRAIYTNGAERHWLRKTRDDFWQRELQHIGQQEVWNGEVYVDTTPTDEEVYATFGYADRYREYREQQSRIAGEFRDILDYWHLARDFGAPPLLNQSFIDCDPSKRIFNIQTQDTLWMAAQHRLVGRRLVSRDASARIV